MLEQAQAFKVALVGGDTSRGERLFISLTLLGEAEQGKVVFRKGARRGDLIFVTGTVGDAALGLKMLKKGVKQGYLIERHLDPAPRVREGQEIACRGLATAMIDISDGLVADLGHILEASNVGAEIRLSQLPLSKEYCQTIEGYQSDRFHLALTGGEDYELLFTSLPGRAEEIKKLAEELGIPITPIGEVVEASQGVKVYKEDGAEYPVQAKGHDHFQA
jgi:thiamine-monophosphate kinase